MKLRLTAILALLCIGTWAQEATLTSPQDSVNMGAPLFLTVSVCHGISDSLTVKWPTWPATLAAEVEIVFADTASTHLPDPTNQPEWLCESQVLKVVLWDTGYVAIPPVLLETTVGTFRTNPILLYAAGPKVDHSATYKEALPPIPIAYTAADWLRDWWWTLALFILALGGIWWWVRRSKAEAPLSASVPEAEVILAHVTAFERLEALASANVWQSGNIKGYHSELNDIFRQYLEGRYGIHAREETTDEILQSLEHRGMQPGITDRISGVLRMADLVKFAKASPGALDNENAWQEVFDFVEKTRLNSTAT